MLLEGHIEPLYQNAYISIFSDSDVAVKAELERQILASF